MSICNNVTGTAFRSALVGSAILIGAVCATAGPTRAASACAGPLAAVTSDWNTIAFTQPYKPAQQRVEGKGGYVISAADYNYLLIQMRLAAQECAADDQKTALQRIALVHKQLVRAAPNQQ